MFAAIEFSRALFVVNTLAEATRRVVTEVERRKIVQAMESASGDRGRAADLLQINFKNLTVKLKEYGLD